MPVTELGKEQALKALAERRAANKGRKPIDNSKLHAGEDMHFGCDTCNADFTVPEDYMPPRPRDCPPCTTLKQRGWL